MTSKTAFIFDRLTGAFLRPVEFTEADMQPTEHGPWRLPDNCLEVAPPSGLTSRQFAAARAGAWVVCALPGAPEVAEDAPRAKAATALASAVKSIARKAA